MVMMEAERGGLYQDAGVLWSLRALLRGLVRRDLAARFAGSAGGVLWAWLQPALGIFEFTRQEAPPFITMTK